MNQPVRVRAWLLVGLLAVVGCQNQSSSSSPSGQPSNEEGGISPPSAFADRAALPACGSEHVVDGVGWNIEARRCLLEAFAAGRPAELVSTTEWVPGEVVVEYLRSLGGGTAEIWVDTSGMSDATEWVRMIGCDFYPATANVVGVRPAPVFGQGCLGPG